MQIPVDFCGNSKEVNKVWVIMEIITTLTLTSFEYKSSILGSPAAVGDN